MISAATVSHHGEIVKALPCEGRGGDAKSRRNAAETQGSCDVYGPEYGLTDEKSPPRMRAGCAAYMPAVRFPAMADAVGPLRKIDGRTRAARTYKRVRRELTLALGGQDHVTPQQKIAVGLLAEAQALRQAIFADAVSGVPVTVADYTGLAATCLRSLKLLGMKRVPRDVHSLDAIARESE